MRIDRAVSRRFRVGGLGLRARQAVALGSQRYVVLIPLVVRDLDWDT